MTQIKGVPDTSPQIIPMLVCPDPEAMIRFCESAFGATEQVRREDAGGKVIHAAMAIGRAIVILQAEFPQAASRAPQDDGSSPVVIFVYLDDVDRAVDRATAAGAKVLLPLQNQFWGDRTARIQDPAGHVWTVASRVEDTTTQERADRWDSIAKNS
jgi:PhnB protein